MELQVAARNLSKQLSSPPIELALVEAAVRVLQLVKSSSGEGSGPSFTGIVPTAVITFLRRRVGFLRFYL